MRTALCRSWWFLLCSRANPRASTATVVLGCLLIASVCYAEPSVRGALDFHSLIALDNRYGGAVRSDLWLGLKSLGIGGTLGVGALSQAGSISSRVFTPFGASLTWLPPADRSGATVTGRGGLYAGARKGGLMAGPWVGGGCGYRSALGEGASLRYGLDVWKLFGAEHGVLIAPFFGLGF